MTARCWPVVRLLLLLLIPTAAAQVAVLDTGVQDHDEFAGLEVHHASFLLSQVALPTGPFMDPDGHGTAAASLIVGLELGGAPGLALWDLQVWSRNTGTQLDPSSEQAAIDAMDWLLRHHGGADRPGPRVALLGFAQGTVSEAGAATLAAQARALFEQGVAVIVPAGAAASALHDSPYVLTVGCMDVCASGGGDGKPDVLADGSDLTAARADFVRTDQRTQVTGSAYAAAHAAATVARIWQAYPDIPVDAAFAIVRGSATAGVLDADAAVLEASAWSDPRTVPAQQTPWPVALLVAALVVAAWRRR